MLLRIGIDSGAARLRWSGGACDYTGSPVTQRDAGGLKKRGSAQPGQNPDRCLLTEGAERPGAPGALLLAGSFTNPT